MNDNPLDPDFQPNVIAIVGNPRRDSRTLRLATGIADGLAPQLGATPALSVDLIDLQVDRSGFDETLTELVLGSQARPGSSAPAAGYFTRRRAEDFGVPDPERTRNPMR